MVSSFGLALSVQISRLRQISLPTSSKPMIIMSLEEGLVMCIGVGTVTVTLRRRRFEFWCIMHAACYLPLPQVAVKAFRFTFAMDGYPGNRTRVIRLFYNQ